MYVPLDKTGEFFFEESSGNLQLILFDGNYYQDLSPKDIKSRNKKPFAKGSFKKDIINIFIGSLGRHVKTTTTAILQRRTITTSTAA